MNFKELDFILNLKADQFVRGARQADQAQQKLRDKMGKPLEIKAKVDGAIASFARLGLALDGIQRTYRLIIGPAKQMVALSNAQEKADQKLIATLKTRNQYTEEHYKLLKEQASAIQAVTTVGDEEAEMLQGLALNMGATLDQVDEFTRGAIGLAESFAEAGLSQEMAMKGIALAYQGNFTQLQRYIPALRSATSETEKMAFLQQAMKDGFDQARAAADTAAGKMEQFSNILGDLKEVGGDLIKEVLIPVVEFLTPIARYLANMDPTTRNTTLAVASFTLVGTKLIPVLKGLTIGVKALGGALLPLTGLLAGISLAWMSAEKESHRAADTLERYRKEVDKLATADLRAELIKLEVEFNQINQELSELDPNKINIWEAIHNAVAVVTGDFKSYNTETGVLIDRLENIRLREKAITDALKERDKAQKSITAAGAGETAAAGPELISNKDIELQSARIQKVVEEFQLGAQNMYIINTDLSGLNMELLDQEYMHRMELVNLQMEMMRNAGMQETAVYQEMINTKWALDVQYEAAKKRLVKQGAVEAIRVGAQLMDEFQGNSQAMFEIGKGASVADALINAYMAAERAFRDYPWPFNIAISATQFALAMAQVKKIESQTFKPAGKAEGGMVTAGDIMSGGFTPGGEDGIIGIRKYEYVMNQGATARFLPLLESMNRNGRGSPGIPGFQAGGLVGETAKSAIGSLNNELIKEAIKEGFRESSLHIYGTIKADGRDIYLVVEKQKEFEARRTL